MKFVSNWQDLPSLLLPESVMSLLKTELYLHLKMNTLQ